jgi:hypothetical protein
MTTFRMTAPSASTKPGNKNFGSLATTGQYILNLVGEAARRAADRSRLAALTRRHLDDVDMTPGQLNAALPGGGEVDPRIAPSALAHSV